MCHLTVLRDGSLGSEHHQQDRFPLTVVRSNHPRPFLWFLVVADLFVLLRQYAHFCLCLYKVILWVYVYLQIPRDMRWDPAPRTSLSTYQITFCKPDLILSHLG